MNVMRCILDRIKHRANAVTTKLELEEIRRDVKAGRTIKAILGREDVIRKLNKVPEEDLPHFLRGVPTITTPHVAKGQLVIMYDTHDYGVNNTDDSPQTLSDKIMRTRPLGDYYNEVDKE